MTQNKRKYKNTDHPLYETFKSMKKRAYTKSYSSYLGNGCIDEWKDYNNFYEWGIEHWFSGAILRIKDKSKPFSPDNCYFEDRSILSKENSIKGLNKRKETCLQKYNVDSYLKTEEGRKRVSQNKKGNGIIHGKTKTPIWKIWRRMHLKCNNPKYHRYEPNLDIHDEWKDFNNFEKWCLENGFDTKLKFERKDLSKGFYPENCVFLTPSLARKKYEYRAMQTSREKFGVDYAPQSDVIKQKQIQTMIDRYGKPYIKSGSGHQNEIRDFLKENGYIFSSNTSILSGKEIDLYNDKLKLGIEYCGIYWHTELSMSPRDRNYHYLKYKECEKQGIQLITIYSDEWIKRKNQVKSYLRAKLGIYDETIYARKCNVSEINTDIAKTFIDKNHIQSCKNSLVYFGLFYNNKLIGCMSLAKHHRISQELILDRLCFESGIKIVGGSSKLLKYAKEWAEQKYKRIITWSDNRWSTGEVYSRIGFTFDGNLRPDYSYVNMKSGHQRKSKQSMKKSKTNCPKNKTEVEYCAELGYARIWDCGKKRWVIKL